MLFKLSVNSHTSRGSSSTIIYPDLDRRFQALRSKLNPATFSKSNLNPQLPNPPPSISSVPTDLNINSDYNPQGDYLWVMDDARLDPSPLSDSDGEDDTNQSDNEDRSLTSSTVLPIFHGFTAPLTVLYGFTLPYSPPSPTPTLTESESTSPLHKIRLNLVLICCWPVVIVLLLLLIVAALEKGLRIRRDIRVLSMRRLVDSLLMLFVEEAVERTVLDFFGGDDDSNINGDKNNDELQPRQL
ncbi:hypothetical protein LguiB_034344 [Lonicera macranthoides]